jgi:4-amino-4-deoxy-L-arabinose transferase-like glycosyltransferase
MRALGTQADWERWWGGAGVFQQAPLYSYLVAFVCAPPQGTVLKMFLLQNLLGVLCVPLAYFLGRLWGDERTGLVAAFLWALCQSQVALESFLLRDALVPLCLLTVLCLLQLLANHRRPLLLGVAVGVALGVASLLRENLLLVAFASIPLAGWLAFVGAPSRPSFPRRLGVALAVAGGLFAALTPLILRNVRVGVPPLALSNRGPEAIFTGLSLAPGTDVLGFATYPSLGADLEAARGSSLRALVVVGEQAAHQPTLFLRRMARRLWGWLSAYEPPDNVDLPYLVRHSPILWLCLPTAFLLGPALVGLLLVAFSPRRYVTAWVLLPVYLGPQLLIPVLWRIRANGLPFMAPLAALGLVHLWDAARVRPWGRALPAAVGVAVFVALAYVFPAGPLGRIRPIESSLAARVDLLEHRPEAALAEFDEYQRLVEEGHAEPSAAITALRARVAAQGEAAAGLPSTFVTPP